MGSKLNVKKWIISLVAVFVVMSICEFIIHGVIMSSTYMEHPEYWRPDSEMQSMMGWMYLGYAIYALLFTLIYTMGYQGKPGLGEGIRYGFWIGLLMQLPRMFITHAIYPYSGTMLISWMLYGVIESIILGIVVAMTYKNTQPAAA